LGVFIERIGKELSDLSKDEKFLLYLEEKVDHFMDNFLEKKLNTFTADTGMPLKKLLLFFKEIFEEIISDPKRIKLFLKETSAGFKLEEKKVSSFISSEDKEIVKEKILKAIFDYLSSESGLKNAMFFIKNRLDNFIFNRQIGTIQSRLNIKKVTIFKLAKRTAKYLLFFTEREIPLILTAINIEKIIKNRIDSFPLYEVEDMLLKIIKDQLKYINIFGALLGFIIGCVQLAIR